MFVILMIRYTYYQRHYWCYLQLFASHDIMCFLLHAVPGAVQHPMDNSVNAIIAASVLHR